MNITTLACSLGTAKRNPGHHPGFRFAASRLRTDRFDYCAQVYSRFLDAISANASDGHTLKISGFWHMSNSVN